VHVRPCPNDNGIQAGVRDERPPVVREMHMFVISMVCRAIFPHPKPYRDYLEAALTCWMPKGFPACMAESTVLLAMATTSTPGMACSFGM
jgi:hypothetical protein